MNYLAEFLLARIAEDEAVARSAVDVKRPGVRWHWVNSDDDTIIDPASLPEGDYLTGSLRTVEEFPTEYGDLPAFAIHTVEDVAPGVTSHIVRWDPARVLAECDAKRRIVDEWVSRDTIGGWFHLACLASPYADHPDYDEAWRP